MKRIWKKLLAFVLVATMLLQYVPEMKATASEGDATVVPTIGNATNLADYATAQLTSFTSGATTITLSGAEVKGDTWYYSGTFQYTTLKSGTGGLHFYFGTCSYYDDASATTKTGTLQVTARPSTTSNDGVLTTTGTQLLLGVAGVGNGYQVGGSGQNQLYTTGKDYTFTIKVRDGRYLSFWIDNTQFYNEQDLTVLTSSVSTGAPTFTPTSFGIKGDGTTGTISDVRIWDDEQINLAYGLSDLPTTFGDPWYQTIDSLGKLAVTGDTWYYSAKYQYSDPAENTSPFCLRVIVGSGTKPDGTVVDVKVGIRGTYDPTTAQYSTYGQYMIWIGDSDADIVAVNWSGEALNWTEECTFTAKVSDKKLTFYVDDVVAFDDFDLSDDVEKTDYKLTKIVPKFGLRRDNCAGTISNFQIWGELAPGTVYEKFDDISIYRGETATEPYPTKEHYVFAGWYEQENDTYPISKTTTSGTAYAKFVDEDVLSVKYQLPKEVEKENSTTKLRLVTTVDSLNYRTIGFRLEYTLGGVKTAKPYTTKNVYKTIIGTVGEETVTYYPSEFSGSSTYIMALVLTGVPQAVYDVPITITPQWVTLDGTTVDGVAREITLFPATE